MKSKGKLFGIGLGPGDPDLLTVKAVNILKTVDVVFVPKSKQQMSTALEIVNQYLVIDVVIEQLEFSMSRDLSERLVSRKTNADIISSYLNEGKNVAFLTLGDPMLYSTYIYVLEYLDKSLYQVETIPGIYSFSAISSLINLPLCTGDESLSVIASFSDNEKALFDFSKTIVCMKVSAYKDELYEFLKERMVVMFYLMSDAGKTDQLLHTSLDVLKSDIPYFSTAIVKF